MGLQQAKHRIYRKVREGESTVGVHGQRKGLIESTRWEIVRCLQFFFFGWVKITTMFKHAGYKYSLVVETIPLSKFWQLSA